ncbi:hypothetical protein D3P09_02175 [Paenibacillus pinisoli]|uniref:Uncharacterized protein n=1 Tax=Paenibacillus pinisoli TaxID=1276110 RepID=A0A3A6PVM8_9BACL|nr:hypothetical protein [Paenibacillus pinisoli]RJX40851.1 hypothetical protein D3P09_02175 [Paenibacillus pinisoli]
MPIWLIIQIGLLVLSSLLAFVFYISKGWRIGLPFNKDQAMKLIFIRIVPILWLSSSFVIGIIYLLINTQIFSDSLQVLSMIVFPLITLTIIFIGIRKRDKQNESEKQYERNALKKISEKCEQWINQFSFISSENVELKVYISKGNPIGKISVFNVNEQQKNEINQFKDSLPHNVYLEVFPFSNNGDDYIH